MKIERDEDRDQVREAKKISSSLDLLKQIQKQSEVEQEI